MFHLTITLGLKRRISSRGQRWRREQEVIWISSRGLREKFSQAKAIRQGLALRGAVWVVFFPRGIAT